MNNKRDCIAPLLGRIEAPAHQFDFLLLLDDDALRQPAQHGVAAELQLGFGHVDGALMMGNHHRGEVAVGNSAGPDHHALIHAPHGLRHVALESCIGRTGRRRHGRAGFVLHRRLRGRGE
jgi:hypothetical protein